MKALSSVLIIAFSGLVFAQPEFAEGGPPPDVLEKLEMIKMWKLTDALDLTEEQAAKLFPAMKDFRRAREERRKRELELVGELREAVDQGADTAEIMAILDELQSIKAQECQAEAQFMTKMRSILSARQQAEYVLFEAAFRKRMIELLREFHRGGRARRKFRNPWNELEP